jgi:Polysaccharide biosynthesis enzyme WcbI
VTKALVVSNCATSAYVGGLKVLFPAWEVRGATSNLASQWVSSNAPNPSFVEYVQDCDIYVGLPPDGSRYGQLLPKQNLRVLIPPFRFRGLQPDVFHLEGFSSALGKGSTLHSRIITASFRAGLTPSRTRSLFNLNTYVAFDFPSLYESEKQKLIGRFGRHRIDLSGSLERWISRGNFLYSYNHPRVDVLMEILRRALVAAELLPVSERERDDDMGVADDLGESIVWPIYPEIARLHDLEGSLIWRRGRAGNYETLDLNQFVQASYKRISAKHLETPELPEWIDILKSLDAF